MGFLNLGTKSALPYVKGLSVELLHTCQCTVCPLDHSKHLHNPKMKASGAKQPRVYVLGEFPGVADDRQGLHFVGPAGRMLKEYLPRELLPEIRWNNVIRCAVPLDRKDPRTPSMIEIEACRPSIIRDIEASQPEVIFGFGPVPLKWVCGETGIPRWAGRRIPVKIGKHRCWYYAFLHPTYILKKQEEKQFSDEEFTFGVHMARAVREVEEGLPEPIVHSREDALEGLEIVTGLGGERDLERVAEHLDSLADEPEVGFDWETSVLRPYARGAYLLSVAIAGPEVSLGIALDHRDNLWTPDQRKRLDAMLLQFLRKGGKKRKLISHHLPFELEWAAWHYGDEVFWHTKWGDTESQGYVLDERPNCGSLDFMCMLLFGVSIKAIDNLNRKDMGSSRLEDCLRYNAMDAKYHRLGFIELAQRIREEELDSVYQHQLERTIAVVPTILNGVPIDEKVNDKLYNDYSGRLDAILDDIGRDPTARDFRRIVGYEYRPGAPKDTHKLLVDVLRMKAVDHANEATLSQVKNSLVRLTLKWRKVNKILSTYILPVRRGSPHIQPDGLVHPTISTCKVQTWRTAAEDPNVQNWPKRDGEAIIVRTQVQAGVSKNRGPNKIVAFDFAGIQARNVAWESNDEKLVKSFWEKYDIHTDWMERILRHAPEWVSGKELARDPALRKKYRHRAKNQLVFPAFFGARAKRIAASLGISESKAEAVREEFFDVFRDIKAWQDELHATFKEQGWITGLSGFRRRAPCSPTELINAPIQADEALIVMEAMVRLAKLEEPRFTPTFEIHDDLTFIWPAKDVEKNAEIVVEEMLRIEHDWINTPIGLEMSVGDDWANIKEVAAYFSNEMGLGPTR